ncbi:MAG: zinc-dependent alcohol dehydrogenase [Fimbriimonas sp.]
MIADRFDAAVLEGPERLTVRKIPQWPLEAYGDPDLILLEVAACGVCGSDFRYFVGENPWAQHTLGRFVPNPPNIVLGHEYAGTVVRVLSEANRHWLGKRVAPICSKVCGRCPDCQAGREHLCPNTVHLGHGQGWGEREFYPGAYGRYVPSWGSECFEIPDGVSFEEAAMMDILAVCVHVARKGDVRPGRPVLCIGAGPAGNGVAQAALAMGASHAVLLDRSPVALDVARQQGFATAIDSEGRSREELEAELRRLAPEGFGSVFDTVGARETIDLGLTVLGKAGTLINMAVHDEEVPINFLRLGSERRIATSCNFERPDFEQALVWLAEGRFRVREWQTPVSLDELPERFRQAASGERDVFKMVVK